MGYALYEKETGIQLSREVPDVFTAQKMKLGYYKGVNLMKEKPRNVIVRAVNPYRRKSKIKLEAKCQKNL